MNKMKKILALLVASTALTAVIGVPAWSTMQVPSDGGARVAVLAAGAQAMALVHASNDNEGRPREGARRGHDDDDRDDDDDDDDEDDDDGDRRGGARDPAPAGTVAPPQNGLFGNGAPPRVQVN